jgi:hypothetical protein
MFIAPTFTKRPNWSLRCIKRNLINNTTRPNFGANQFFIRMNINWMFITTFSSEPFLVSIVQPDSINIIVAANDEMVEPLAWTFKAGRFISTIAASDVEQKSPFRLKGWPVVCLGPSDSDLSFSP